MSPSRHVIVVCTWVESNPPVGCSWGIDKNSWGGWMDVEIVVVLSGLLFVVVMLLITKLKLAGSCWYCYCC